MKEKEITTVKVEPMKEPVIACLKNDLDSLQKAVSIGAPEQGLIEFVWLEDNVSILCNEEGKLIGLEPNRRLGDDILCGVFYIVAENDEGELISPTDLQQERYSKMFRDPDLIFKDEVSRTVFSVFLGG
jgi:hypothetical protein